MARDLTDLLRTYRQAVSAHRGRAGRRAPRQGSAVLRLLDDVTAHPIETAATATARLQVTTVAARDALDELTAAGVYRTSKIDKGTSVAYLATDVLNLADDSPNRPDEPHRAL